MPQGTCFKQINGSGVVGTTMFLAVSKHQMPRLSVLLSVSLSLLAADATEEARKEIVAAYQQSLDGLARGDPDAALRNDTDDWISITVGQKPRTRKELEPYIRRDIASMKPPEGWSAVWKPDYERNGTATGIQIYDLKLEGNSAIVLCLVGGTRTEIIDGITHSVWGGSHVRDTWIRGASGWKRRMHEKLTVNERMVDGRPVKP